MNSFTSLLLTAANNTNTKATPTFLDTYGSFILIGLMFVAFYFFLIRPQKKREKAVEDMRSALDVGDTVITIGGISGKIVKIKDDKVVIETGADRVRLEFVKAAIQTRESAGDKEETKSE